MNLTDTFTLTAAQVADALGQHPQAVRRALAHVPADAECVVRGNLTKAWQFSSLPEPLQSALQAVARQRRLKTIEHLFNRPSHLPAAWPWCEAWQPEIPWNEVCPPQQAEALKLERALAAPLQRRNETGLSADELNRFGVAEYQREFRGRTITPKRWRYLFDRILTRDRGREQFQRPELFLPGNLKRAAKPAAPPADCPAEFQRLWGMIRNFTNPMAPTTAEKSEFWKYCFAIVLQPVSDSRRKLKRARLRVLKFLWQFAPWLAASPNALRMALNRAHAAGLAGGGAPEAFVNGSAERRGVPTAPPYDPAQVGLVKLAAAKLTGGRRAQAARELNDAGAITDPRLKKSLDNASSKSYLPASIRTELTDVPAWRVCYLGQRAIRKMLPRRELTYDGIYSMTCLVGDDHTPDLYVAVPNAEGWFDVMRPQLLLITDFRSARILSRAIVPSPQYSARDVLAAFKRALKKYGRPQFILREGGLWRNSKLVNSLGDSAANSALHPSPSRRSPNLRGDLSAVEVQFGLERKGIRFCDTPEQVAEQLGAAGIQFREAYQANAKPVEGIIGLFTHYVQRLPCYCGNDERLNCPQSTKEAVAAVRARKARPEEAGMLVWRQWVETADSLIRKYNAEKQEGRRVRDPLTGKPISPNDAFEIFTNQANAPLPFDADCEVLLNPKFEVEVTKPDIRRKQFPCGYVKLLGKTYCDEQTGARIGRKLIAHFDPEFPQSCTFTDLNWRNPFTVPRLEPNNALFRDEQTALTSAQAQRTISRVAADYRAMEATFEPVLQQVFVAPHVKALNAHTQVQTQAIQKRKVESSRLQTRAAGLARKLGLPPEQVRHADAEMVESLAAQWHAIRAEESKPTP